MSEKLYPELPWTDEDEAIADQILAEQIAAGDTGSAEDPDVLAERTAHAMEELARLKREAGQE